METNLPFQKLKQTILFVFLLFIFSITNGFGQSFPPENTSCTSSDLAVVAAQLSGGDICNSCETAVPITRTLTLSIDNTTGSTRTSFAFWGNLEIYDGTTGELKSSTVRTGCGGPLPPNSITSLSFGDVTYNCGDIVKISNIWEAWTSSSPNEICPLDPNNISPKCGKIPSITVNAGVNGEFVLTQSQCGSATGAIDLTPTGGTPSYTYLWSASNGGVVPSGQQNNQDLTNLLPGTYTVQITDSNGCTTTKTREIQTNPTPNAVATPASQTICSASTITTIELSGNVASTTFNWTRNNTTTVTGIAASGSGNISGSLTNTTNAPVTVTFTITPTANNCPGTSITATVTVNPLPTVTVNSPTTCAGTPVSITATPGTGTASDYNYTWTVPIGVNAPGNVASFNSAVAGTYSVIITNKTTNCVSASASGTLSVNPLPIVTVNSPTTCAGSPVSITATPGTGTASDYNYAWTVPIGVNEPGNVASFNSAVAGTYSVIITNKTTNCVSASASGTLSVNPLPTVTVNSPTTCAGTPVSITATPGTGTASDYNYAWTVPIGVNEPGNVTSFNSAVAGTYSVIITNKTTNCVSASASGTLSVNPLPTATIGGTTAVCKDATAPNITFTGAGGTAPYTFTYKINGGSDLTVTTTSGNSVTVAAPTGTTGSFIYSLVSVKDTSTTTCSQAQNGSVTITVNPLPTATIDGTTAVCKDATAPNVTFTGAGGTAPYTFTYKINGGSDLTVTTTSGNSVTVAAPTGTTGSFIYSLVSVKDTSATTCSQAQTGSATITVNPLPTATIGGTTAVCKDGTAPNITFTGAGGTAPYTFTYKINGGSDLTVTTTSGNLVTVAAPTGTAGSFIFSLVSVKDASATTCSQAQNGSATITVNPLPTATISGTTAVCKDATAPNVTFTGAGGTAPYTFTYKINNGSDLTVTTTSGNSVTVAAPTGTTGSFIYSLVSVKDTSATTCSQAQTGSATITVNPLPTATISGTTAVCKDGTAPNITFTGAGGTAPYTFTYKINDGSDLTVTTTSGNSVTVAAPTGTAGSFIYSLVSVKDASATTCSQAQNGSATITVNPLPTATIGGTTAVCKDATAPNITFTGAGGTAPYTFTYKINNGSDLTVTTTSGNSVTVAAPTGTAGSFIYSLVSVKDASATTCSQAQTGSATITVNPLPTATISGTTAVCKDATAPNVTFTGAGGTAPYTFTYKINDGSDLTVTTTSGNSVTVAAPTGTAGSFIYSLVSVKDASATTCSQAQTGSATITVNPLPTATIGGTTAVCKDATAPNITFTGAGGTAPYTFTYKINNGSDLTVTTTSGNSVTVAAPTGTAGSFIYSLVSVKDASATTCSQAQTGSATITVNPLPTATISGTTAVCKDATAPNVTFTGAGGTAPYTFTYKINDGSDLTVTTTSGNSVTVTAPTGTAGSFIYSLVSVKDDSNTNCSQAQTESATITVNPLPSITTAATAAAVCYSTNAQVTSLTYNSASSTPTSYSIVWNSVPANSFATVTDAVFPESPISINIPAGTAAGTYTGTITLKNANGCVGNGTTFTVTVNSCLVSLVKQSELINTGDCTSVGDKIKYTFTLTNLGTTPITNITITDPLFSAPNPIVPTVFVNGDTNSNLSLDTNETWVYNANYAVTQNDIDTGRVTNQATVNGLVLGSDAISDLSGTNSTNNDPTITQLCQNPKIAIVKTNNITVGENGCAALAVGDVVTYTFTITNPGNVSLHNINVSDPHPELSAITLLSGDINTNNILEVNETWIFNASYNVTQADIDTGKITNQASVSGLAPDNSQVNDLSGNDSTTNEDNIIPICATPKIAIVKTNNITVGENGCAALKVGDVVTYTFTVTNPGNVSLHNINVSDPHPGLSAITLLSGDINTNNILEVNETWIFNASYNVTQADIDTGKITNQASVSGLAPDNSQVNDQSGNDSTTNEDNVIPICTMPKIGIVKTNNITVGENGCAALAVGDVVVYTFTITNPGNVSLHNINVSDPHTGLSAITLQSGDINTNNILEVNETWIFNASYNVTQADIDTGKITNQASVSGLAPDNSQVNDLSGNDSTTNEDNVIPICATPKITITKDGTYTDTNQDGKTNVGDTVSYNFVITNTGNVTLTNITVTDNNAVVSGGPIASLTPGATDTTTFSASHTITQDDINKGFVYNLALATAKDPKGNDVTDTSSDPTPCTTCPVDPECTDCTITELNQSPSINITKDGTYTDTNQDGKTNVGDTVSYNFVITNTGNVTLTNITVTDNNAVVSGGPIASLTPGATDTTTFSASHTITQDDINKGFVYNLALATAKDPKGNDVTDTSSDPTPCTTCPVDPECTDCTITELNQSPSINITKDGTYTDTNQDGKTNVGDTVSYNFVITNTGNVTLTNITVTDNNAVVSGGPIASLTPGATDTTTFSASHTITQDDINKGFVYNLALATAKDPKGNDVTDTSSDPTPCTTCPVDPECADCTITELNQSPSIALVKTAVFSDTNNDGYAQAGEKINYAFTVTNTGNVTISNITITDPLAGLVLTGNPIATLAPAASNNTVTGIYTLTQADIDAGRVTNSALATGKDPKNNNVTDTSGTTVDNNTPTVITLPQNPGLSVNKTAVVISRGSESEVYSFIDDVINYTIIVTNTGNVTINNIIVKDPLTGLDTTSQSFSLAPGESKDFSQSYTITLNDMRADSVTNTATANGQTPDNTPIAAEDSVVVEKAQVLGCGTIVVHNAFTPNGDTFNEIFKIDNIEDTLCYPENSVEIYNRWGVLVYEARGYNNQDVSFKGFSEGRVTVDKSAGLPTGTYFYILNYTAVDLQGENIAKREQGYLYLSR